MLDLEWPAQDKTFLRGHIQRLSENTTGIARPIGRNCASWPLSIRLTSVIV